jgi:hypothetical protein
LMEAPGRFVTISDLCRRGPQTVIRELSVCQPFSEPYCARAGVGLWRRPERHTIQLRSKMTRLSTLGPERRRTSFSYYGSTSIGVTLQQTGNPVIDAGFFEAALQHFAGREVKGGFKEDDPSSGGFGEWVQSTSAKSNSRKLTPRHASFMAAILCHEAGVESWLDGNAVWLRFPKRDR